VPEGWLFPQEDETMLTLIAEITLTVIAWRKGWRWWALLPGFLAFAAGFVLGAAIGISGGNAFSALPYSIFIDIVAIFALICMAATDRYDRGPSISTMLSAAREIDTGTEPRPALSSYGDDGMQ
jgi:hypothetical protein